MNNDIFTKITLETLKTFPSPEILEREGIKIEIYKPKTAHNKRIPAGSIYVDILKDDRLHSYEGRAARTIYSRKGKILRQEWRTVGELENKNDLPAVIEYSEDTGKVTLKVWMENNFEFRAEGRPSRIEYDPYTGRIIRLSQRHAGSIPNYMPR